MKFTGTQPCILGVCFVLRPMAPKQKNFTIWPFTGKVGRPCHVMTLSLTLESVWAHTLFSPVPGIWRWGKAEDPSNPHGIPSWAGTDVTKPLVNEVGPQLWWSLRRRRVLGCLDEHSDLVGDLVLSSALHWGTSRCSIEGQSWAECSGRRKRLSTTFVAGESLEHLRNGRGCGGGQVMEILEHRARCCGWSFRGQITGGLWSWGDFI